MANSEKPFSENEGEDGELLSADLTGMGEEESPIEEELPVIGPGQLDQIGKDPRWPTEQVARVRFVLKSVKTVCLNPCPRCHANWNTPEPGYVAAAKKAHAHGGELQPIRCNGCGLVLIPEGNLVKLS